MDWRDPRRALSLLEEPRRFSCQCGKAKSAHRSLCDGCWAKLPASLRREFGREFDAAYRAAVEFLQVFGA